MQRIPLSNTSSVALVDDEDHANAMAFRWLRNEKGLVESSCPDLRKSVGDRKLYLHRLVMDVIYRESIRVRFKDGDGLNCQKSNLYLPADALDNIVSDLAPERAIAMTNTPKVELENIHHIDAYGPRRRSFMVLVSKQDLQRAQRMTWHAEYNCWPWAPGIKTQLGYKVKLPYFLLRLPDYCRVKPFDGSFFNCRRENLVVSRMPGRKRPRRRTQSKVKCESLMERIIDISDAELMFFKRQYSHNDKLSKFIRAEMQLRGIVLDRFGDVANPSHSRISPDGDTTNAARRLDDFETDCALPESEATVLPSEELDALKRLMQKDNIEDWAHIPD